MSCQDMEELMQRYLDHDLNPTEQQNLISHMERCGACSELFARLQKIAGELENLPKVFPKVSLVDLIMPQLAAIDSSNTVNPVLENEQPIKAPVKTVVPWMRGKLWKTMAGTAAACIVFAAIYFGNQHFSSNSNSSNMADATQNAPTAMGLTSESMKRSVTMDNSSDQTAAGDMPKTLAPKEQYGIASILNTDEPEQDQYDVTVQTHPSPEGSGPIYTLDGSELKLDSEVMTLSIDGKYGAEISNQQIVIGVAATGDIEYFGRIWPASDKLSISGWSQDNILTYDVAIDGKVHTFQIDMTSRTETEIEK